MSGSWFEYEYERWGKLSMPWDKQSWMHSWSGRVSGSWLQSGRLRLNQEGQATDKAVKKLDAFRERCWCAVMPPLRSVPWRRRVALPTPSAALPFYTGGLLRLKPALEARLGPVQREALLCSYAAAAMLAGKNDVAKEAVRWAHFPRK